MTLDSENLFQLISVVIILITAIAVIVGAVIRWSRHQNELNNMVIFCIKYLTESKNIQEKIGAANALGHARDPAALLVLIDVSNDNKFHESEVRHSAIDALYEMSSRFKKYDKIILALLKAIEEQKHQEIIDILVKNFELNNEKKYVQSAYVIAKEYIKLQQYDVAKEWLHKADSRNRRSIIYVGNISELIHYCNEQLFLKGDSFYRAQNYFEALEFYSLASSELDNTEKNRFCDLLRLTCTYCKLQRYHEADEATLLALRYNQEIDDVLQLNLLLQRLTKENPDKESQQKEVQMLDNYVDNIMNKLFVDNFS